MPPAGFFIGYRLGVTTLQTAVAPSPLNSLRSCNPCPCRWSVAMIQRVIRRTLLRRARLMTRWGSLAFSQVFRSLRSLHICENLPPPRARDWSLRSSQARTAPRVVGAVASGSVRGSVWRHTPDGRVPPHTTPHSTLSPPPLLLKVVSARGSVRASPPPHPQRAYLSATALRLAHYKSGR